MKHPVLLLSLAIFASPMVAQAAKADGPKAKAMAQYDLNRDGKLDASEIATIRKAFGAEPAGALKRFDADADGTLSDSEIAKMVPGSGKKKDDATGAGEQKKAGKKKTEA